MNAKQAEYPQLRFKDFTDPWEQRKLGKMGTTFTGLSGKTRDDFGHGEAKFVTYMNVFSNPVSDLNRVEHVEIDSKQNKVQYGDIFFTTSSETPEEVGMSSVWLGNSDNTYLNSFCFGYRPTDNLDFFYMAYMLRSNVVRKNIVFLAQGISRYNISKKRMMEIAVPVPKLSEQKKIGTFFQHLDNLITLHQRKLAKLTELKQGYLQKLFPQNGSKFPQLRFAGFADAWEQRKLGEIVNITMGQSPQSSNYTDNPNDHILVQGNADMKNGRVLPRVWTTQVTKTADVGDLILSVRAPVGEIGKTDYDVVLGRGVAGIIGNEFIYQLLGRMNSTGFWTRYSTGSTFESINSNDIKDAEVLIPRQDEQIKIGNFFQQLDHLITLHQRKLEKLQELKKGYLQKMFC